MIDLFGLEQQTPRKNDCREAAAITGMTCQTCLRRLDVTLWGCWLATGCRVGLVICANCQQHKGPTT